MYQNGDKTLETSLLYCENSNKSRWEVAARGLHLRECRETLRAYGVVLSKNCLHTGFEDSIIPNMCEVFLFAGDVADAHERFNVTID